MGVRTGKSYFHGRIVGLASTIEGGESAPLVKASSGVISTKKVALVAVLVAVTVVLSPIYFPVGSSKCYPAQHMINGIAGVLVGPWYAALMALFTGIIRNMLGMGTLHAFPGGIPGALVVGLFYRYVKRTDLAALTEPFGTVVIGATISALVVAPYLGKSFTVAFWWVAFGASSIPGSIIGFLVLKAIRRLGYARYFDV
ncbi:energy coupling factor transporter S component ThiW [Candidatus Bathyarchaeota archaeon]|nr:energy coupling factor transporter S component ThiW [Candidatus Bathyarchaeota archaeon]